MAFCQLLDSGSVGGVADEQSQFVDFFQFRGDSLESTEEEVAHREVTRTASFRSGLTALARYDSRLSMMSCGIS